MHFQSSHQEKLLLHQVFFFSFFSFFFCNFFDFFFLVQTQTCAKVLPANGGRPSGGAGEATVGLVSGGHGDIAGLGARSPRGILRLILSLSLSLFFLFFLLFFFFVFLLSAFGGRGGKGRWVFFPRWLGEKHQALKMLLWGWGREERRREAMGGGEEEEK